MPVLSDTEIFNVAVQAGFSPDQAVTMTAIALAESGGDTQANLVAANENSIGLWQINRVYHDFGAAGDGSDPLANAIKAYEVSGGGTDIGRWTVTHADKGARYLQFRDRAEAAARAAGHPEAQGQWDPPLNYYSPKVAAGPGGDGPPPTLESLAESAPAAAATDAAQADAAEAEAAEETDQPDSAGDGLLDAYKERIGLDAEAVDTDQDGFADAYELQYGTDARDYFANPLVGTAQEVDGEVPEAPPLTTELPDEPEPAEPAPPPVAPVWSQSQQAPSQQAPVQAAAAGTEALQPDALVQVAQEAVPASPDALVAEGTELDMFLDAALSQQGATYIFGEEEVVSDPDPMSDGVASYDCSSLIRWAAGQAGVDFTNGSWLQYLEIQEAGTELTVEEALQTPGALMFNFSTEPVAGGDRPSQAHVAISLGDGRLMEARGTKYGVGIFGAEGREFSHAGFIPELGTEVTEELMTDFEGQLLAEPLPLLEESSVDTAGDGLLDEYKALLGLDAFSDDSDSDGFLDSYELQYGTDPLAAGSTPLVGVEPGDIDDLGPDDGGEIIDRSLDEDVAGPGDDVDTGAGALAGDEGDDVFGDADADDGDSDVGIG